jgi:hypothetical protein
MAQSCTRSSDEHDGDKGNTSRAARALRQESQAVQNRKLVGVVSVLVALLGCDDEDKGGGASSEKICEHVCSRSAQARCRNDVPNCESSCVSVRNDTPVDCDKQLDAFTYCVLRASFTCDASGKSEATECAALEDAWTRCYVGGASGAADAGVTGAQDGSAPTPGVDSGVNAQTDAGTSSSTDAGGLVQSDASTSTQSDAGSSTQTDAGSVNPAVDSGVPGMVPLACAPAADDESCETCLKGSCCTALQACGPECGLIGTCVADPSCVTQDCFDLCYAAYPGGAAQFQALTQCAATGCSTQCAD